MLTPLLITENQAKFLDFHVLHFLFSIASIHFGKKIGSIIFFKEILLYILPYIICFVLFPPTYSFSFKTILKNNNVLKHWKFMLLIYKIFWHIIERKRSVVEWKTFCLNLFYWIFLWFRPFFWFLRIIWK